MLFLLINLPKGKENVCQNPLHPFYSFLLVSKREVRREDLNKGWVTQTIDDGESLMIGR